MGSPVDNTPENPNALKKTSEHDSAANSFPKFHEIFTHPQDTLEAVFAGPKAGLTAAKHAFDDKLHGVIQLGEEVVNASSQHIAGRDVFSKEQIASNAPKTYDHAAPYTYNWYFEQVGAAAPLVAATAIASRLGLNSAAKSLRTMEKASVSSLILDSHNLATRPSPMGLNFKHSAAIGFASEFISPINEPSGPDASNDALGQRIKNGVHGAISMAAMSAGGVAVESFVGSTASSFLKKTAVATAGGALGGAFSYGVDALHSREPLKLDELGQSMVGAALVGGTFSVVSGRPKIDANGHPLLNLLDKEHSKIFDNQHAFRRALSQHVNEVNFDPNQKFFGADARGLNLRNFDFGTANLHNIDFRGADLRGADFSKVRDLQSVNFENANLDGAKFSRESQPSIHEPLTSSISAKFRGANLANVDFTNAVIYRSDFVGAALNADTNFSGAHLQNIRFNDADLRGVDFSKARTLHEVNFSGADLAGTNFTGRSLFKSDLYSAKNIDSAIFSEPLTRTPVEYLKDDPARKFIEQISRERHMGVENEVRLRLRATTLPESAWNLPTEDFIKAARWSVPYTTEPSAISGIDPYESLHPWQRAALSVKLKNSWSELGDVRELGRERFLQDFATTDQQIAMFHPKANESTVSLIEAGVQKSNYANRGEYLGSIKYLKLGEFEKQLDAYKTKLPHSDVSLPLLKVVSNLGDNSSRYLQKVEKVWVKEQVEQAKAIQSNPLSSEADLQTANNLIKRLDHDKPEISIYEQFQLLAHSADFLTLHNFPVNGKNSLSDWLTKNVVYQHTEILRNADGEPLLDENGKQQNSITMRMRSKAELQMIATNWETIPEADRANGNFNKLVNYIKARLYPNAADATFAAEAAKNGIKMEDFDSAQERYLKSQSVPSPFPLEKTWHSKDGVLTAKFIPRNDARGIFLGNMTDCCQHPNGPGAAAAWYGQEASNSGFFVVSDAKGNVVAQSMAWISKENGLVFDSIEGKGVNGINRAPGVVEAYKAAAKDLASSYSAITVGAGQYAGNAGLVKKTWAPAGDATQNIPLDLGYTDAQTQYLLATNGKVR